MFYPKLQIKKVELRGADAGVTGVSIVIHQFIVFKTVEKRLVFTSSKKFINLKERSKPLSLNRFRKKG